jgi:hypothetical protein
MRQRSNRAEPHFGLIGEQVDRTNGLQTMAAQGKDDAAAFENQAYPQA